MSSGLQFHFVPSSPRESILFNKDEFTPFHSQRFENRRDVVSVERHETRPMSRYTIATFDEKYSYERYQQQQLKVEREIVQIDSGFWVKNDIKSPEMSHEPDKHVANQTNEMSEKQVEFSLDSNTNQEEKQQQQHQQQQLDKEQKENKEKDLNVSFDREGEEVDNSEDNKDKDKDNILVSNSYGYHKRNYLDEDRYIHKQKERKEIESTIPKALGQLIDTALKVNDKRIGDYCVGGRWLCQLPLIQVNNMGIITFPLLDSGAQQIIAVSQTYVSGNVKHDHVAMTRNHWLPAEQVTFYFFLVCLLACLFSLIVLIHQKHLYEFAELV